MESETFNDLILYIINILVLYDHLHLGTFFGPLGIRFYLKIRNKQYFQSVHKTQNEKR